MVTGGWTIGSLFSGIGGLELGIERAIGGRVVWQAESNPFCREVLAKHWQGVKCYEDVRDVGHGAERVDILCGGFPCQDISIAGTGAGIDGARSGLWSEYARIIGELRPRVVVVENVAALRTRGLERVLGDLSSFGYDAWWDCIPAAAIGAPHRRDRFYLVAWRVPNTERDGLRHESERGRGAAPTAYSGHTQPVDVGEDVADTDVPGRQEQWVTLAVGAQDPRAECACCNMADAECARLQGAARSGLRSAWGEGDEPARGSQANHGNALGDSASARQLQPEGHHAGCHGRAEHTSYDGPPASNDVHAWRAVPADTQPAVCRLADGVSDLLAGRSRKLKALGNAVVPQVAAVLGPVILEALAASEDGSERGDSVTKEKKPANQHRITPQPVLDAIGRFMPIALDPCWNEYALTEAEFVCDGIQSDGLAADWGAACAAADNRGGVFVNPPWNNPLPWLLKAAQESQANPQIDILVWLPSYPETEASSYIWNYASRICFWGHRVNHPAPPIDSNGAIISGGELTESSGSMWVTWLAYFGRREEAFDAVFQAHGNVVRDWLPQDRDEE